MPDNPAYFTSSLVWESDLPASIAVALPYQGMF